MGVARRSWVLRGHCRRGPQWGRAAGMRAQPRQGIHGVREPALARLRDRGAARWQRNWGRRLHALRRREMLGAAILAGLLATTWRAAGATLELACGNVRTFDSVVQCKNLMPWLPQHMAWETPVRRCARRLFQ